MDDPNKKNLRRVSREIILRNFHQFIRFHYGNAPLWFFVRDACLVDDQTAKEICWELGWNPMAIGEEPLPKRIVLRKRGI